MQAPDTVEGMVEAVRVNEEAKANGTYEPIEHDIMPTGAFMADLCRRVLALELERSS